MDLVVVSEVRWGYFRTRKQFLLSRFPERWRIFFAQPPFLGAEEPWKPRRIGRVTFFTVPFLKPSTTSAFYNYASGFGAGRAAIEAVAESWLQFQLGRLGVERSPVVLTSNIYCPTSLSRLRKKLLFYDFNDSPFQFAATPSWARAYWPRTLDQVDALFVVSRHYCRELAEQTSRPLILLGNGVEMGHFEPQRPVPQDLADLPRPRIGYVGLMSHFLDFESLETLRQNRRGGTLVLIGPPSAATDPQIRELASKPGVALLGPRAYEDLPGYVQGLDVGIIPFRANDPHVRGINPNKVYQYLAAGLPVVTSPVLDLEPTPPELSFAMGPQEFCEAVSRALDSPRSPDRCRELARPHDWDVLAARMVAEIERRVAVC